VETARGGNFIDRKCTANDSDDRAAKIGV
jgi:hypothetical protein